MLVKPPGIERIQEHTPDIEPVSDGRHRPFWSVMIPTYNCGRYLQRTLESVLSQDPGPDEMQIEVVDGCSTEDDPEELVRKAGGGRVGFHRLTRNQGGAHTFNTCIRRSRGQWVHILHGDDVVLPDFYKAYRRIIAAHPGLAMVCGRVVRIDEHDRWLDVGGLMPSADSPIIEDFAILQAGKNRISFPSVVVPRAVYEKVGGFCTLFAHAEDMDMWFRVGRVGQVACTSQAYSCFRIHGESETSHLMTTGANVYETYLIGLVNYARLSTDNIPADHSSWLLELAEQAEGTAWRLNERCNSEGALNQARWAWNLAPNYRRLKLLLRTWLKHRFPRLRPVTAPSAGGGH